MRSEWKVTANPIGGKIMYGIFRTIDINKLDHSGNREDYGVYLESREEAVERAKYLNAMKEEVND